MKNRGFENVRMPENRPASPLPLRGSRTSAGYDFYAVGDLDIPPQCKVDFFTDVKAYMRPGEMLLLVVRSSAGIKNDLMLANTVGIIDSDFYGNPDNDGNIKLSLRNLRPETRFCGFKAINISGESLEIPLIENLCEANTVHIKAGERVVQGIFVSVLEADNCNPSEDRLGGLGSSGL
jgi:dUTP pyrophosphatase